MRKPRSYRATFTHAGNVVHIEVKDLYMADAMVRAKGLYKGPTPYNVTIVNIKEEK